MTFDYKISESVSLSRIFDCFIVENEKPSVILNFLKKYNNEEIVDILKYSDRYHRILSLDFVSRMSGNDILDFYILIEMLYDSSYCNYSVMALIWKILQSNLDENSKRMFRGLCKKFPRYMKHPYSGVDGEKISRFESIFKDIGNSIDDIIQFFNSIEIKTLEWYARNATKSLFIDRIFEDDIFNELSFDRQYCLISTAVVTDHMFIGNFFIKQTLCSSIDVNLKNMIFENSRDKFSWKILKDGFIRDMVKEAQTYPELMMKMNLYGLDECAKDVILALLLFRIDFLIEMYEDNPEMIRRITTCVI